jgi:NADPH-dependent 2,4-dienoyl-CoA reductase/sulfur reductase-like enzyme
MHTKLPDVYAAGDCVHTYHRLLADNVYLPLGSTAHKQGRVAGENAVGGDATFAGSLGTQAVKVFDLVAAGTGLRDDGARAGGYHPITVATTADDHKAYYPGATPLRLRVTGDRVTGRLLGAQILGSRTAEVAKRIDIFATAISYGAAVADIPDLDLSYTPPLSSPWDAVQIAATNWTRSA